MVKVKKGNTSGRKSKKKEGSPRILSGPSKKLKQSNLHGMVVEYLDFEGFSRHFKLII